MEKIKINIFGASGHAGVVIDAIYSGNEREINRIFDDNEEIKDILGFKVTHPFCQEKLDESPVIIGIGDNYTRLHLVRRLSADVAPYLSHSAAVVSTHSEVGKGTVIMANAVVNPGASIGIHCIINTSAVVEHEVVLEDFVHISPNASIAGNVHIGEGTHIGIGAVVIPGIKIGKWATVGAGAVIIKDIPDFATVVGNPGRTIKISEDIYGSK